MKLYSLKKDLSSLLVYVSKLGIENKHGFIKLWPLPNLDPNIMELYYFGSMNSVTEVEPYYFESYMSIREARRHNLMKVLWGIKW